MKKLSESFIDDVIRRSRTREDRKEDIPEQDPVYWWRYIELKNGKKYPKEELKSLDISFGIVRRVEKAMNVTDPELISIYFKNEVWDLVISRVAAYGINSYAIDAHGEYSPYFAQYSKLTLGEKRGIKQRLEEKTFYIYPASSHNKEYILRENPEVNGEKGVLLK